MIARVPPDLFGERPETKLEVHEHSIISGPRACRGERVIHSHAGGDAPHQHPDTGPASYIIDKDDWLRETGLSGGGRKSFTAAPTGEQLPTVELEDWQKTFEVHVGAPPPGFQGTGGGMFTAARMILGSRMTVSNVVPFPSKPVRSA